MMRNNILDYLDCGGLKSRPHSPWIRDAGIAWTFAQFDERVSHIGSKLINSGLMIGDVVAVFIQNSAHVLAADFGITRAGGAFMNVDVNLPATRVRAIFDSVKPKLILANRDHYSQIPQDLLTKVVIYENLLDGVVDVEAMTKRRSEVIDTDPVCLITTSGSTGVPKAVALSHRGLIDFVEWFDEHFEFQDSDIVGSLSPLFFDGYIPGLFMSLLHGGQFVILPKEVAAFPVKLAEKLAQENISFIFWVPSTLVPMAKLKLLDKFPLPQLRFIGFAGEVMPPSTLGYLRKSLPQAQFVNFYGPIEISVICSYFVVPRDFPYDQPIPIGYPCTNTRIILLNDHNELCAPGEIGELCVAGSCVALGYWNNPEKTTEAFVSNPLIRSYAEKIYRTGDLATADADGLLSFVGRKDFQIKHQGYRIDLAEIEHTADVSLNANSCCVVYDRNSRNITLFYEAESELTAQEIRKRLGESLPKYMLPTKIVRLQVMPLNPNGKIDRRLLEKTLSNH